MSVRIHPTAIVEDEVVLGPETAVWHYAHIRRGTHLGQECIVGGQTTIAYDVVIGNRVKINSAVYICHGVELEDGVMVAAGTVFTNDRFPRATTPDLTHLRPSDPDDHTYPTLVRQGATIGANATIGNNLSIGRFAMVGMGSVVTRDVPDFHLVVGNPARTIGCVCRCGQIVLRYTTDDAPTVPRVACSECQRNYAVDGGLVRELDVTETENH